MDDSIWDIIAPKPPKKKQELLDKMRGSTSTQESDGNTSAVNPDSAAKGEFQVMDFNIPSWTKKYYKKQLTPEEFLKNPEAQRAVFDGEMGEYLDGALKIAKSDEEAVRMAAVRWYGGRYDQYDDPTPQYYKGKKYPSRREYTTKVANRIFNSNLQTNNESFWEVFPPQENNPQENSESFWDIPSQPEISTTSIEQPLPQGFSTEPDMAYMKENGLISETPDEAAKALLDYRKRVQEELERAKTPARREILKKRLETIDKQIRETAKKVVAHTAPEFQPLDGVIPDKTILTPDTTPAPTNIRAARGMIDQKEADLENEYNQFLEASGQLNSPKANEEFNQIQQDSVNRANLANQEAVDKYNQQISQQTAKQPVIRQTGLKTVPQTEVQPQSNQTTTQNQPQFRDIDVEIEIGRGEDVRKKIETASAETLRQYGFTDQDIQLALAKNPVKFREGSTATDTDLQQVSENGGKITHRVASGLFRDAELAKKQRLEFEQKQQNVKTRVAQGESELNAMLQEGILTPEQYNTAKFELEKANEKEQEFINDFIRKNSPSSATNLNTRQSFGNYATPNFNQARSGETEQFYQDSLRSFEAKKAEILSKYGSFENYYKEKERIEKEYGTVFDSTRPLARPLQFAKNFGLVAPKAVASVLKAVDIAREIAPITPDDWVKFALGQSRSATDGTGYKIGKSIENYANSLKNKDFQEEFWVTTAPDALGQVAIQLGLGVLTGGATAPVLLGSAMGASEQYDEAVKKGAGEYERKLAAIIGGVAAVSDAIPFAKFVTPQKFRGFLQKYLGSIFNKSVAEVGEEGAVIIAKGTLANVLKKGKTLAVGAGLEGFQELSEKKINDLVARLTYDPKRKLFVLSNEDLENLAAGMLGGVGGASVEIALDTESGQETPEINDFVGDIMSQSLPEETENTPLQNEDMVSGKTAVITTDTSIKTDVQEEKKQVLPDPQKVEIKGKGEGIIVEDKGDKVLVDYNNGNSRALVRKNQITPIGNQPAEVGEKSENIKNIEEIVQPIQETVDIQPLPEQKKVEETIPQSENVFHPNEIKQTTSVKPVVQGIKLTPRNADNPTVSNATKIAKEVGAVTTKKVEKEFIKEVAEAIEGKDGSELAQAVHAVIEDFKPDEEKSERKFSSTQVDFPEAEANEMRDFGKRLINDEVLHEKGREERPHFTTKFGLTTKDAKRVRPLVENLKPFKVKLGKTFIFENEDFDVVNIGVENSPELEALNKIISENTPNIDTYPDYVIHAALAYVKPGEGKKYVGNAGMEGKEVEFNGLTFAGKDRVETFIPFGGKRDATEIDAKSATETAHGAATSPLNNLPEPTQAQIEAGNYKKGHISINGLDITVENPVNSERKGVNPDGKPWSVTMKNHYGYIKRSKGADEEHLDIFVKDGTPADFNGNVFVVDQITPDSEEFDEHKVLLGFSNENEAREAYLSNYTKGWKGLGKITQMSFDDFKDWAKTEQKTPLSDQNDTEKPDISLPNAENESKNKKEVKSDAKSNESERDSNRSDENEKSDVVQGTEPKRRTSGIRFDEGGKRDGDVSGNSGRSPEQGGDIESSSAREDSAANDGEQSSEGISDSPSNRVPERRGNDYLAPVNSLSRTGSWRETAKRNLDIIELVKKLETENRLATPEEQSLLIKFTGWGASEIANNLFPGLQYGSEIRPEYAKDGWKDLAQRAKDIFTPEELKTAARSTRNAHYTSESIVRGIWNAVSQFGFVGGKVLEPGMGVGLFGAAAPESIFKKSRYTGIERDSMTARIAKQVLQNQAVLEADFVKQSLPDNFFDVAIGNPPFSDTKILNDPRYKKYRFMTHDYFFAKSIDKVRPGGILVFVTSKGTMDKTDPKMREYINQRADLLGAIRLPQTAFKENAGTEVVTDVLFFRKRMEGENPTGENWLGLGEITAKNKQNEEHTGLINEYFINHPEMVLGQHSFQGSMYRANEYTVIPNEGNIDEQFQAAIENLPSAVYAQIAKSEEIIQKTVELDWNPKDKKEGSLYLHDDGRLLRKEFGAGRELDVSANEKKWLKSYVELRIALKQAQSDQLRSSNENDTAWKKSLEELNRIYEAFVRKHGNILEFTTYERKSVKDDGTEVVTAYRRFKNNKLLNFDVESPLVEALETITEDGKIIKSAMLLGRTIKPPQKAEIKELSDALAVSLDTIGKLNLSHVTELYQKVRPGITRDEVVQELGDAVFETPSGEWQLADEYLSGFVIDKLEEAETAAKSDLKFQRNVDALLKVQPQPLETIDISATLGAAWIGAKYTSEFAKEVLGLGSDSVTFEPMTNTWSVDGADGRGSRGLRDASNDWGTSDRSPNELLDSALNNRTVKITFKDSDGKTHTDVDATALANEKIKLMKESFRRWIWTDAKRSQIITEKYNRQFNNIAPRFFDGSHLSTPGLSSRYKLHPHQKRAVWRILQTGNTYLAHAVGAGKTLEMIVSGMEQKRLGLISKPMYVVPNHMLKQFSSEFLEAYPLANILVADENNFAKDKRQRFTAQAALNDLDAIVITHSAFGLIRTKQETADVVIDEMISQMRMAIAELDENDRAEKRTIKDLENRIEKIEQKFGSLTDATAKDDVINFEDLGVDFVYVDEAHEFRKLDFVTNRTNVKGIDPKGSQRSLDLLIKLRWLETQRPGRSAVLASGTPITNTLAELYSIMRYLDPQELETAELSHFDAWSAQFGEAVADYEMNAAGNYEIVERFSRFVNIPELMKRARKFMDVLTLKQLGSLINLPTVKGGQPQIVVVPATEAQTAYLKGELAARIQISRDWKPSKDQPGNPDPLINIITDGRLAAIDMRFVNSRAENDPNSKLNVMIDNIISKYNETLDLEYRDKNTGEADGIKGATQIVFSAVGFGEQVAAKRGFDAKAWIIKRLTESGIPLSEIAFMSDYKTAIAKERMFREMRQGTKKILIGSPKNMGTGVNVQKRLKIEHYLSPPWYPSDVEQPDGRIIRQGNQNEEVEIYRYATKGTYDSTAWAMIARKSRAIEQAMTGDDSQRNLEDISESSQYEMASAVSAGDDRAIKLAGLRRDIEKLERLRGAHSQEQRQLNYDLSRSERAIESDQEQIKRLDNSLKMLGKNFIPSDEFSVTIGNLTSEKRSEIGQALKSVWVDAIKKNKGKAISSKQQIPVEIGKVLGKFPLRADVYASEQGIKAFLKLEVGQIVLNLTNSNFGLLPSEITDIDAVGLSTRIYNGLNGIAKSRSETLTNIETEKRRIKQINSKIGQPFADEQELYDKIAEYAQLQAEMAGEGRQVESEPDFLINLLETIASNAIQKVIRRHLDRNSIFTEDDFVLYHGEPETLKSVIGSNRNGIEYDGLFVPIYPNSNLTRPSLEIQEEAINYLVENLSDLVADYFSRFGNKIINADNAKELFPQYVENRLENDKSVQSPASALSRLLFRQRLEKLPKNSYIEITAGGMGSGKSTAIANSGADLIYDSVMGNKDGNRRVIDAIIENGHFGRITFVYRPIENAVVGNMRRSLVQGRLVSENNIVFGHFNSLTSFLDDTFQYATGKNFEIVILENIENQGLKEISLEALHNLRYTNIDEIRQRTRSSFEQEYKNGNYSESLRTEFNRLQGMVTERNRKDVGSQDNSRSTTSAQTENEVDSQKQILSEYLQDDELQTLESLKNLPFVSFDDLLQDAVLERFGDKIKVNPQSHEIFRRAFEQARIESGQAKIGSNDAEDLFAGIFLKPETIAKTIEILQRKADEAQSLGYSVQEIEVFSNHAKLLKEAAEVGKQTAIIFVFDKALPEEIFHQSDYVGAAEKSILSRHDEKSAKKLDSNPITQKLLNKHFSHFNEYNRLSPKMLKAVLRAEIAPFLVEMSDADLTRYGITKDERDDYLLTWFEGYAEKNGIDALDNFEREELNVQEFIQKIKETKQIRQDGQGNEENSKQQNIASGESRRGPPTGGQNQDRRLSGGNREVVSNATSPVLGKNEKLASLPATLRRAGIETDDVIYEVFGDKSAQASARKLLAENGIEGSIKLLRSIQTPDVDHAILSFMLQRILLDNAAEITADNPTEAENLRSLALKLGREHALKAVKAGRFTRAASIVQNSVEGVMYAVQGIIEEKFGDDKTLSPEEWARIEAKAREGEKALTRITELQKDKINLQAKIRRLENEKEGKKRKRRSASSMPSRKKLVELVKNRNGQRIEEIRQKLLEKFAPLGMKSIIGETANLDLVTKGKLETAKKLEKSGENTATIYFETGWERGADGKWRTDLPGKFQVNHKVLRSMLLGSTIEPLDAVLDAPELFTAYPQIRDIAVAFETMPANDEAFFDAQNQIIALSNDLKWTRALGLTFKRGGGLTLNLKHEIQHAIQHIEDFSKGANSKKSSFENYRRKAGEVEARNAERRFVDGIEEPISGTEDIPRFEQIFDEPSTLKSVLDDEGGFDEETLNDFAEIGAMFLIEGLASETDYLPQDFHAQMVSEFGDVVAQDFQKIYEKSWAIRDRWLSDIRTERTRENIRQQYEEELEDWQVEEILGERKEKSARRRALEVLHRVAANKATLSPSEKKLADKIDEIAPNNEIAEAAKVLAKGGTRKEVYKSLKDVSEVDKEKIYRNAVEILSFAQKMKTEKEDSDNPIVQQIEQIRSEIKENKKAGKKETAEAMRKLRQFNNLMERLNQTATTPKAQQISDIIVEIDNDIETAIAASMIAYKASLEDIYSILGVSDRRRQREILRRANEVFEQAKEEFNRRQKDLLQQIADAKNELRSIGDLQWQARNYSRQATQKISNEIERIKSGELSYRTGQIIDILNASRTLMASFDLSASLRQGGFFSFTKPGLQKQAFANMFKSFSEKSYGRAIQQIEDHPQFILAQRAGIDFAVAGKGETDTEELYRGKATLEKIPVLGKILNTAITGWSERTYTAFLDTQRIVIFDVLSNELFENGLSLERNKNEFEKIAEFINVATGRGTAPASHLGKILMDLPFFAPRYTLSRLQLLNQTLNPVAYYNMPPHARKIVAKSAVRFYGTTAAILFLPALLGMVSFDPDDDEFLKIKVGNTKYDIFAGLLPPAKMIIKVVHSAIRTKLGQDNRIPGEFWYDVADLDKGAIPRFVRGKLSPLVSLGVDAFSGKDFVGNEFTWSKGISSRLLPITFFDIHEAYKLDGTIGVARSVPFSMFGIGVNNYKARLEKPRTAAEKLAVKATAMKLSSKPQTKEEKEQRERISELTFRSRMGEDVSDEAKAMASAGLIPEDKIKDILSAKIKSYLVDRAENLSLEEFEAVFKVANQKERTELLPLLNKKFKNADVEGKLTPEMKKELQNLGGKILGDVPMPDDVRVEFERFGIKTPDVGETISLKKGEKTKLSTEQYEKYRQESLERIYKKVQEKMNSDAYMDANEVNQEKMLRSVINKERSKELKETKRDLKFQAY